MEQPTAGGVPSVTVLGNLSVDVVDGAAPSPGGCPAFAVEALTGLAVRGRVVTRAAPADLGLFEALLAGREVPCDVLASGCTGSFALRYRGEERALSVLTCGPVWQPEDVAAAAIGSTWVHVSPLLRSDFPVGTLRALAEAGHLVSYDGQGLVRAPRTGPLQLDAELDPRLLDHLRVLKLADAEADVVAGGRFDEAAARSLGVPEVLVTHGSVGCDLYVDGTRTRVPAPRAVHDVHPTGAGDMFAVAYVAHRAGGAAPAAAAQFAALLVADRLESRLSRGRTARSWSS
jgi:sugar/nucleoside kinase (ribokinase family)